MKIFSNSKTRFDSFLKRGLQSLLAASILSISLSGCAPEEPRSLMDDIRDGTFRDVLDGTYAAEQDMESEIARETIQIFLTGGILLAVVLLVLVLLFKKKGK